VALTASDIYLGTELPKRTVIRIIDKLETLNVVQKTIDRQDRRVTRIGFSPAFTRIFDRHLEDSFAEQTEFYRDFG
jgi:DNA-binding MarR family transcriptional regulator